MIQAGAIILAAGQSSRMGRNKLTADLGGKPIICHSVDAVVGAGLPPPLVVTGHDAEEIERVLGNRAYMPVPAPDYALGMAHSIAAGIRAVPAARDSVIICLGDMPLISSALLEAMAKVANRSAIVVPHFGGKRGNPVLWGRDYFEELANLRGDRGAKDMITTRKSAIIRLEWNDHSVLRDIDTPADLAQFRD